MYSIVTFILYTLWYLYTSFYKLIILINIICIYNLQICKTLITECKGNFVTCQIMIVSYV